MIRRLFLDHPASVGETYPEHFGVAARFGARMLLGGAGALVHAVLPFACQRTGSRTVAALHREVVANRGARRAAGEQMATVEYVI